MPLRTDDMLDLIRIGVYAQMEGNYIRSGNRNNHRFRFYLNQIEDMEELLTRVVETFEAKGNLVASVSSKDLYDRLMQLGFYRFRGTDWNVPRISSVGVAGRQEYIRAVIDCLGNVDVKDNSPYVQLTSVNKEGLEAVQKIYGGLLRGPYQDSLSLYLAWYGKDAIALLESVDWKFHNRRNQRGAELIKNVRWSDYLI